MRTSLIAPDVSLKTVNLKRGYTSHRTQATKMPRRATPATASMIRCTVKAHRVAAYPSHSV